MASPAARVASGAARRNVTAAASSYRALYHHFTTLSRSRRSTLVPHRRLVATTSSPPPQKGETTETQSPADAADEGRHHAVISTYLPSIRQLASSLPHLRRPPTAAELLPLARSWGDRLHIRFKWLTIRSFRPFRSDEYSAFASVILILNVVLLAVGTTTFIGVVIFIFNKAGMEDRVARWLSDYMTGSTGVSIVFESAVVPRWRDGRIRFGNVYVSRGGLGSRPQSQMDEILLGTSKATLTPLDNVQSDEAMHFHLTIESIDVNLSMRRWLNGKGLVRSATINGVRGVVDRSHMVHSGEPVTLRDRQSRRREAEVGDFWLEHVQLSDVLVTIFQPNQFRPYTCSVFNANIRKLRKQWLLLDLLSSEQVTGQIDNCLFSLHRPQSISRSHNTLLRPTLASSTPADDSTRWETRLSRFRIDGVPVDHIQTPQDTGALAWIRSGRVDLVADIFCPIEIDQVDLKRVVREIVDNIEKEVTTTSNDRGKIDGFSNMISERPELAKPALTAPRKRDVLMMKMMKGMTLLGKGEVSETRKVVLDLDIRLKDVKASLPLFSNELSYVNTALIRPMIAFVNANRTLVPIRAKVEIALEEFNGSWTAFDVGLTEAISEEVYAALAHHITSESAQSQRLSQVGKWGLHMTANTLLELLRGHLNTASMVIT